MGEGRLYTSLLKFGLSRKQNVRNFSAQQIYFWVPPIIIAAANHLPPLSFNLNGPFYADPNYRNYPLFPFIAIEGNRKEDVTWSNIFLV